MLKITIVEICDERLPVQNSKIFTTLEGENPGGSIKDHMVLGELKDLLTRGQIKTGDTVSEISAGSTAKSLAYYCRQLNLKCALFVPNSLLQNEIADLKSKGAMVYLVDPKSAYQEYEVFCAKNSVHPFDQMTDFSKGRHYETLGSKITEALGRVDLVIGAVGTGHSLLGLRGGIKPRPVTMTAEPSSVCRMSGVRNLQLERYGDQDRLKADFFDRRSVMDEAEIFSGVTLMTDKGEIIFSDSFRLVLAAAQKALINREGLTTFLVGAANHRK